MKKRIVLVVCILAIMITASYIILITLLFSMKSELTQIKNDILQNNKISENIIFSIKSELTQLENIILQNDNGSENIIINFDDRFFINDPVYRIYKLSLEKYYYQIGFKGKILAEDIIYRSPNITYMGGRNGIVKFELGCGTNCLNIQYYGVYNDGSISDVFFSASAYGDYINYDNNLIAYFIWQEEEPQKHILVIQDIFDTNDFYIEIERDFANVISPGISMVFLNDKQLYAEYMISKADDLYDWDTTSEIINFR